MVVLMVAVDKGAPQVSCAWAESRKVVWTKCGWQWDHHFVNMLGGPCVHGDHWADTSGLVNIPCPVEWQLFPVSCLFVPDFSSPFISGQICPMVFQQPNGWFGWCGMAVNGRWTRWWGVIGQVAQCCLYVLYYLFLDCGLVPEPSEPGSNLILNLGFRNLVWQNTQTQTS